MTDPDPDPQVEVEAEAVLALEPDDLDGHTIEQLDDYLDRDRRPADPSIDNSPACQIALAALQRLHELAGDYLDQTDAPTGTDEDWIASVLAALPLDTRAGRRFPYDSSAPDLQAHITEAAVRGLVRAVGDAVPGLLIGKVDIRVLDDQPAVDLAVRAVLQWGVPLAPADTAVRTAIRLALPLHAPFAVRRIDLRITDVVVATATPGRGR